jgi:8-oxo-dGTP pyrophosphatase MutT (NUDIX family)
MIKVISKNELVNCISSVKNAGDKDRSIVNYSEASILILFINNYIENNSLILMTKRKNNLRKHAGQIAFPGGRKEREDKDLKDTVQRETEEEVNIPKENYDIIGNLPKFFTGTGYVVTPFLAIMKQNSDWKSLISPNLSEVEKIFYPKSYYLLSPKFHLREKPPINSSMFMTWKINYNDENIWGLTARVLVTISAGLGLREFPPCDDI